MISCTCENGRKASLRHVVADAIVIDNKILLVRRAAHLINGGEWAIPGGFLDPDEIAYFVDVGTHNQVYGR